eukprot:6268644-Amphidinium_carterae.2
MVAWQYCAIDPGKKQDLVSWRGHAFTSSGGATVARIIMVIKARVLSMTMTAVPRTAYSGGRAGQMKYLDITYVVSASYCAEKVTHCEDPAQHNSVVLTSTQRAEERRT